MKQLTWELLEGEDGTIGPSCLLSVICLTGVLTEDDMMEGTIASIMLVSEVVLLQNDDIIGENSCNFM